ncbi:MAG: glutathione peroxidase [Planctomycetes bacterium]|nr:glutathione peroxidase [Planctomycetota bacterium]
MFEKTTATKPEARAQTLHAFQVEGIDGRPRDLAAWKGKVVLVVNTASECGFTSQYEGLQKLQERYGARGFDVLAFPSNDFGGQEPGTSAQIAQFCSTSFGTTFPLFAKVAVKSGTDQAPLYRWLGESTGKLPGWNFGKYLIGKDGQPIAFWPSTTKPEDGAITSAIEQALPAG